MGSGCRAERLWDRVYLDPKEPTFLGFLTVVSIYKSLKQSRSFRAQVGCDSSLGFGVEVLAF